MRSKTSNGESTEPIHFKELNKKVTQEFIDENRKAAGWVPGSPYREEDRAAVFIDGASGQWAQTTEELSCAEDKERLIGRGKCAAAATSQQNACDKGTVHRTVKKVERTTDSKVTHHSAALEARFAAYIRNDTFVNIADRKLRFIASTVAAIPTIYESVLIASTVAAIPTIYESVRGRQIMESFELTGQGPQPSLERMLENFPMTPPTEIRELIKSPVHSKDFFNTTVENGTPPEEMYTNKGVPEDQDHDGNIVTKEQRITQTNHWRAIALTGGMQQRLEGFREIKAGEKTRKLARDKDKAQVRRLVSFLPTAVCNSPNKPVCNPAISEED